MSGQITVSVKNRTNKIKVKRPPWDKVYEGYPKRQDSESITNENDELAEVVFSSIFGNEYDKDMFVNACATRLSLSLLNGGMNVEKDFSIKQGEYKEKGIITSAAKMINWLKKQFGEPDVLINNPTSLKEIRDAIGDRKGIYGIIAKDPNWASGHVTLWYKNNAIGGNDYYEYAKEVYFWELK